MLSTSRVGEPVVRVTAEDRARALLRSVLTPEQLEQYDRYKVVPVPNGRRGYVIVGGGSTAVHVYERVAGKAVGIPVRERGRYLFTMCVVVMHSNLPEEDHIATKVLYARHAPKALERTGAISRLAGVAESYPWGWWTH